MTEWYWKPCSADQALIIEEGTGRNVAVVYTSEDAVSIVAARNLSAALAKREESLLAVIGRLEGQAKWCEVYGHRDLGRANEFAQRLLLAQLEEIQRLR